MLADRLLPVPSCADCERIGLPMPPLLVRLEQDLGPELVGAFLLTRGGQELSIPSGEYRGPHPEVVGWFQRNVGFGKISIPIGPASSRTRLAWSIYNHLRDEASLAAVARAPDRPGPAPSAPTGHGWPAVACSPLPRIPHDDRQ